MRKSTADTIKALFVTAVVILTLIMMLLGVINHSKEVGNDNIDNTQYNYNHR